jgi:flagellar FliJ protein
LRFRFRYESLLAYRLHLKERAETELGKANKALKEAQDNLASVKNRFLKGNKELITRMRTTISSGELNHTMEYLNGLEHQIASHERTVEEKQAQVRDKRAELLSKTKEYKVMAKLKEKDRKRWEEKAAKEEQKILDELAVIRHGRAFL